MADVLDPSETVSQENGETDTVTVVAGVATPTGIKDQQEPPLGTADINDIAQTEDGEENDVNAVTTDILQQAFVEASGGEITHIDECLSPESEKQHLDDLEAAVVHGGEEVDVSQQENFVNPLPSVEDGEAGTFETSTSTIQATGVNETVASVGFSTVAQESNSLATSTNSDIVGSTPLGSKGNPIRIIQQGNTYKSTQKLSQDQIQQIVQVLQRQNLATKAVNGGPTAVYNPETNTRIVYRVVQPHDRSTTKVSASLISSTANEQLRDSRGLIFPKRGRGRPRKRQRTQSESSDSEDASDPPFDGDSDSEGGDMAHLEGSELSPTEKLRKKREKPRTRSGRVSKPPTHMVKDYKQIHRVDWYEDYDDDDGGYSDIYDSENEGQPQAESEGLKPKQKYGCDQCEKAYVGVKSLARHYKMTGHGDPATLFANEETSPNTGSAVSNDTSAATEPEGTSETSKAVVAGSTPGVGRGRPRGRPRKRPLEDGAWRPPPHVKTGESGKAVLQSLNGPGPGRPPLSFWERNVKRLEKLNTTLSAYSCTEVLQSLAPRMKKDHTSLYDILRAGLAAAPGEQKASYTCMLQMYTELQAKMTELASVCLRPLAEGESVADDKEAIQIVTETIAHSIGIEPGVFEVSDLPKVPSALSTTTENSQTMSIGEQEGSVTTGEAAASPDLSDSDLAVKSAESPSKSLKSDDANAEVLGMSVVAEQTEATDAEQETAAEPAIEQTSVTSTSAIAEAVSKLQPGDIITVDGQKIVIPEGAHIVQSEEGIAIYAGKEEEAACIINLKLGTDPGPPAMS